MKKINIIWLFVVLLLFTSCSNQIKVACVGDSITEGYGLANQSETAYPVVLDSILGQNYSVVNLGRSATTLRKKGDFPYWICKEFYDVFAYNPDIIIIMLGTNDTKSYNWNADSFAIDYQALVDTFKTIQSKPKIYVCLPAPVFKTNWGINDSTIKEEIPIIEDLAKRNNLNVIDLYNKMKGQEKNFPDGVHPNEEGAGKMAAIIANELKK